MLIAAYATAGAFLGLLLSAAMPEGVTPADTGFEALVRALGFSPYGAVMIWIAFQVRAAAKALDAKAEAFLEVGKAWVTAIEESTAAIRLARGGGEGEHPPYRRPVTGRKNRVPPEHGD